MWPQTRAQRAVRLPDRLSHALLWRLSRPQDEWPDLRTEKRKTNKPLAFKSQRFVSPWLQDGRVQRVNQHSWLLFVFKCLLRCSFTLAKAWLRLGNGMVEVGKRHYFPTFPTTDQMQSEFSHRKIPAYWRLCLDFVCIIASCLVWMHHNTPAFVS